MALQVGFSSGKAAVEGGLGVGASTSKGVPSDKRSLILEDSVQGIALTIGSWSGDGDHWTDKVQHQMGGALMPGARIDKENSYEAPGSVARTHDKLWKPAHRLSFCQEDEARV